MGSRSHPVKGQALLELTLSSATFLLCLVFSARVGFLILKGFKHNYVDTHFRSQKLIYPYEIEFRNDDKVFLKKKTEELNQMEGRQAREVADD